MKLIIAIVQDEDSADVIEALTEEDYRVTKLATTGGFLKSGNTTLLVGIEEEKVELVIDVIRNVCRKRNETVVTPTTLGEVKVDICNNIQCKLAWEVLLYS